MTAVVREQQCVRLALGVTAFSGPVEEASDGAEAIAKAAEALPEMADEARQRGTGAARLFVTPGANRPQPYKHEDPVEPAVFLENRAIARSP